MWQLDGNFSSSVPPYSLLDASPLATGTDYSFGTNGSGYQFLQTLVFSSPAKKLVVPNSSAPNGGPGATRTNQWTMVIDVKLDAMQPYAGLIQFNPLNNLLASSGASASLAWNIVTVDNTGNVGSSKSLIFGPDGNPAIAYSDSTNFGLKFARYDGAAWVLDSPASASSYVGVSSALAFGPDGRPAISCRSMTNGGVYLNRFNGGAWACFGVDGDGESPLSSNASFAFGPDGRHAIDYFETTNGDLRLSRRGIFTPKP
jgi:hypothetical protein